MIIGVPKEIKTREYRVGMTPAGVRSLTSRGHKVLVEKSAGEGAGMGEGGRELAHASLGADPVLEVHREHAQRAAFGIDGGGESDASRRVDHGVLVGELDHFGIVQWPAGDDGHAGGAAILQVAGGVDRREA